MSNILMLSTILILGAAIGVIAFIVFMVLKSLD